MSVSCYSKLFVGFEVKRSDFIETVTATVATCAKGHKQKGTDAFCAKDGGKFQLREVERPTKALKAIHTFFNYDYDEASSAEDNYRDFFNDGEPLASFENHSSFGSIKETMAAGCQLTELSYFRGSLKKVDDEEMEKVRIRVEGLRRALGMEDRPIRLYHEVCLS